jgi:hypothetical protein
MNINTLIQRIKKDIGLNGILSGVYSDTVLRDSIINVTLPKFNQYHGFNIVTTLDRILRYHEMLNTANFTNGTLDCEVRLPHDILHQIEFHGSQIRSVKVQPIPMYNMRPLSTGVKDELKGAWQVTELNRINRNAVRVEFRYPDILVIPDYGRGSYRMFNNYKVYINCTHPKNLSTITIGLEYWFEELAKYDIMINLWNNELKMVKAEIGNTSVDAASVLDNFSNAEGNRRELLENIQRKTAVDAIELVWQ